jgi:hypothetical protein
MFAAFTTAAHFCVSAAMKVERSSGEPTSGLALSLARIAPISLVFIIALISARAPRAAMLPMRKFASFYLIEVHQRPSCGNPRSFMRRASAAVYIEHWR